MQFPDIPAGLLAILKSQFPDRCPRVDVGAFEFGRLAGQQEVIEMLEHHHVKQQEPRFVPNS